MKLYHGSKEIINNPVVHGSKPDNDYGPAFYLTRDLESAHEWACRNNSIGVVNHYDFNISGLKVLDLRDSSKYSVLNWLAILLHYRSLDISFKKRFQKRLDVIEKNFYIDVTQYDVVIGYRADDAYFRFPLDFIRGNLILERLDYVFLLGELGVQYVLMSERAINRLKFIKSENSKENYIYQYFRKVEKATFDFDEIDKDEKGTRIFDLMEEYDK